MHRALQLFREGNLPIEEKLHDALHLVFRHVIARYDHGTHTHGLCRFTLSCVGVGRNRAGRVVAVALGEHIHRERVDREHTHADAIGKVGDRWGRDSGRDECGIDLTFLHRLGRFGEAQVFRGEIAFLKVVGIEHLKRVLQHARFAFAQTYGLARQVLDRFDRAIGGNDDLAGLGVDPCYGAIARIGT